MFKLWDITYGKIMGKTHHSLLSQIIFFYWVILKRMEFSKQKMINIGVEMDDNSSEYIKNVVSLPNVSIYPLKGEVFLHTSNINLKRGGHFAINKHIHLSIPA